MAVSSSELAGRFRVTGSYQVTIRPSISEQAIPRPQDRRPGGAFELHELGSGGQLNYELQVEQQLGILFSITAIRDGQQFNRITTLRSASTSRSRPRRWCLNRQQVNRSTGPETTTSWSTVTLTEARRRTPFTVLMPDKVPSDWQVQCRLMKSSNRPHSPIQLWLIYHSTDGHESVSLTQAGAGVSNPYGQIGNKEDWEELTQDGSTVMARPANWGQAQVYLERDGTFVYLMSDNLTRDQLLRIAAGLRPAPSTSSI